MDLTEVSIGSSFLAVDPHVGDLPGVVQAEHTCELPGVTVHRGVIHHHVRLAEPADDAEPRGSGYLPLRMTLTNSPPLAVAVSTGEWNATSAERPGRPGGLMRKPPGGPAGT